MAVYRLGGSAHTDESLLIPRDAEIDDKVLLANVHWFIKVRWIVVIVFIAGGIAGTVFVPSLRLIGLEIPSGSLYVMAALLILINSFYFIICRGMSVSEHRKIAFILWIQITADLMFVTNLVYHIGCTDTFASFLYMIHIALSCIFFPKGKSIFVVTLSSLLFLSCVLLQNAGILEIKSIFLVSSSRVRDEPLINFLSASSAVFIWYVLWYFISRLSEGLRQRERSLRLANEELRLADKEKTRKVIVTTHDLKAPFVGIESNISVLKYLHWDDLPDSFRTILDKIEIRSKTLRERINKILELGNLRMEQQEYPSRSPVSLKRLFDSVIGDMADQILEKKIELKTEISDVTVNSDEEKLTILFSNLVSNAVFYTPEKGLIEIKAADLKKKVRISIIDTGIGIEEKYLDKIFEEYFRTPEAKEFNAMSTGLGLQIVKTVVEQLGLSLTVDSERGKGTTFTVEIEK